MLDLSQKEVEGNHRHYLSSSEKTSATITKAMAVSTMSPPPMILNMDESQTILRGITVDHKPEMG
jgi:hypothetical protein